MVPVEASYVPCNILSFLFLDLMVLHTFYTRNYDFDTEGKVLHSPTCMCPPLHSMAISTCSLLILHVSWKWLLFVLSVLHLSVVDFLEMTLKQWIEMVLKRNMLIIHDNMTIIQEMEKN
jgi:hypothetical protein